MPCNFERDLNNSLSKFKLLQSVSRLLLKVLQETKYVLRTKGESQVHKLFNL